MTLNPDVVILGEDVAKASGVFKAKSRSENRIPQIELLDLRDASSSAMQR